MAFLSENSVSGKFLALNRLVNVVEFFSDDKRFIEGDHD